MTIVYVGASLVNADDHFKTPMEGCVFISSESELLETGSSSSMGCLSTS